MAILADKVCEQTGPWLFHMRCDKCGHRDCVRSPTREETQIYFYQVGWWLNTAARKYIHTCRDCNRTARKRKRGAPEEGAGR